MKVKDIRYKIEYLSLFTYNLQAWELNDRVAELIAKFNADPAAIKITVQSVCFEGA